MEDSIATTHDPSRVVAVVDGTDRKWTIWWVNTGLLVQTGQPRLCGAWQLNLGETREVESLIAGRFQLMTGLGRKLCEENDLKIGRLVNPNASRLAVLKEVETLQKAFDTEQDARPTSRKLVPPRWPSLPEPIEIDGVQLVDRFSDKNPAFGVAAWLQELVIAWELVEEQRMLRPFLLDATASRERPLPLVLQ